MKTNIRTNLIVFLFLTVVTAIFIPQAGAIEVAGDITTDTFWNDPLTPYIVTGDITIAEGVTLTIGPGVVVEFQKTGSSDGYQIQVDGTLRAIGEAGRPILFTIDDKAYYWGHIEFTETSTPWDETDDSGCMLQYSIIEYAGNGKVDTDEQASVRCVSASILIENSIVRYGKSDGIRTKGGTPHIMGNRIHDTQCGVKMITPDAGQIQNNYLVNNQQGIYMESGDATVDLSENTIICSSSEGYGSALGVNMVYHNNLSSFFWEQVTGIDVDINDPDAVSPQFTVPDNIPDDETLTFQVTVTDSQGIQAVDTVDVNVTWDNVDPVADAGPDQSAVQGALVTLDGSNSFDPDGGDDATLIYTWSQMSGPTDVTGTWTQDVTGKYASFIAPVPVSGDAEDYVFQLRVADGSGAFSLDSIVVTVTYLDPDNESPVADAGTTQTVTEGDGVPLIGTDSYDPDGVIVSYVWHQTEGESVDLDNPFIPNPSFTVDDVETEGGTFTFQLTVKDDGNKSATDTVVVNIIDSAAGSNNPPTAEAEAKAEGQSGISDVFEDETIVTLDGSGSDDGDTGDSISSYVWKQISGPGVVFYGGTSTGSERNFAPPNVTEDTDLVFRLTVSDSSGLRSTADVTVRVLWINEAPVADPGADQTVGEGLKVQLDGSGSVDEDDGIKSYLWEQVFGTEPEEDRITVDLFNANSAKAIFIAPDVDKDETLAFALLVTDHEDVYDYGDNVHVTITADNTSPAASAGPDQVVGWSDAVSFSGSHDPVGSIVSYLWEEVVAAGQSQRVELFDATTENPYFTAPAVNPEPSDPYLPILFRLTVTDDAGNESVDTVIVNVTDTPMADPPTADAGIPQTVSTGATVTLDGSNSIDPDLVSEIQVRENYFLYDIPDDDDTSPGNIVAMTRGEAANCHLTFEANDIENVDADFSIYLYGWADDDTTEVDLSGNWWGTLEDSEISDLIYDVTFDTTLPEVIYQPFEGAAVPDAGSDLSAPPMADAGEDQTADPDDTITLSCPEVDDTEGVFVYQWVQTGGLAVILDNADTREATFVVPALPDEEDETDIEDANPLLFTLTVTDPYGFFDTDEVKVTINAADEEDDKGSHSTSGCFISASGEQTAFGFIRYFDKEFFQQIRSKVRKIMVTLIVLNRKASL